MKKVTTAKFIAVALAFFSTVTSCTNEKETENLLSTKKTNLSVKVAGVIKSRAVEAPGSAAEGTIELVDGYIFVVNPLGAVTYREALNVTNAAGTGTGQVLAQPVASDSRVYIVGNSGVAGMTAALAASTTLVGVKAVAAGIGTQTNYAEAALANTGDAVQIVVSGTDATVSVSLQPVISRIELTQVKGGADITAFTVEGVYVDSYHSEFTFGAGNAGTVHEQATSTDFTSMLGVMQDAGAWVATDNAGSWISAPTAGDLWAYQVASGGLPRFIIKLTGVKYMEGGNEVDSSPQAYYLTVKGYTNGADALSTFERGKIYKIGGTNGITFTPGDLGLTPNPVDVDLTVNVEIIEWEIVEPDAELM